MKQTPDDMLYPSFEIEPENIQILNEPSDYYEHLKVNTLRVIIQ